MESLSRRSFLALSGGLTAGVAAAGIAAGNMSAPQAFADEAEEAAEPAMPVTVPGELATPEVPAPDTTSYECDVLVVGCGISGLNAACAAADAGKNVIVVEKGTPGYGGLSPFAVNTNFFDADFGDDMEKTKQLNMQANEYVTNLDWTEVWCNESKDYWNRINEWGIVTQYPHASDTEYWVDGYFDGSDGHDDKRGYYQSNLDVVRQPAYLNTIESKGIEHIDHTMVFDVIEQDGRVVGAMALHVPSGAVLQIKAKAVILCTGTGSIKPMGFPTGGGSFDGLYIGYKHGLPISGMEFEDYHLTYIGKPGLILTTAGWAYCENIAPGGPGCHADTADSDLWGSGYQAKLIYNAVNQGVADPTPFSYRVNTGKLASDYPDDPRIGNFTSPETSWGAPGAAPGMSLHMESGINNGWDDLYGATYLPGLYCAGDGTYASCIGGAGYDGISGLTTSSCGVQGNRAGQAAAQYADSVELVDLPADTVQELTDEILAPLSVEKGFSPVWVNQQLLGIMSNQAVLYRKTDAVLNGALAQIEYVRDYYLPMLKAKNPHELRICREVVQKTTAMEIKLREGLARKESRGMHYRVDYPYRDDDYLGYFTATKTDDGMDIEFLPVPDSWKGDTSLSYVERYGNLFRFEGEAEALGIEFPEVESSWGH